MAKPQTITEVSALASKLERLGFVRRAGAHRRGDHVQVRAWGLVACGVFERSGGTSADGVEFLLVESDGDVAWYPAARVKACSRVADGRCTCAAPHRACATGAAMAPPPGNTGITASGGTR